MFKDKPIRQKLTALMMVTSGTVLLLTCVLFAADELLTLRRSMVQNLSAQADILAANSTAALAFRHEGDAAEILAALNAEPHIVAAGLYDQDGKLFSTYPTTRPASAFPATLPPDGYRFAPSSLTIVHPVVQGRRRLGTLYLQSDMGALHERFRLYGSVVAVVIVIGVVAAFALSTALQTQISQPILALAETAKTIAEQRDYSVRATKRSHDEFGLLTDAFNHMLDQIDDQNRALRESEERFHLLAENSDDVFWFATANRDRVLYVSPAFEKIWGRKAEVLYENPHVWMDGIHLDDRPAVAESWRARADGTSPKRTIEYRVVQPSGRVRWVIDSRTVIREPDGSVRYLSRLVRVISDRRLAEDELHRLNAELEHRVEQRTAELSAARIEADRANQAKTSFLSAMSHDLRTPLNAILGFAQLLEMDGLSADQTEGVRQILSGGRHLLELITEILDITRIESGRLALSPESVDVHDVVSQTIELIRPLAAQRGIAVDIQPFPANAKAVLVDRQRFKQILLNLLSNAVKYNREHGRVTVRVEQIASDKRRIAVSDTGVGIPQAKLALLFQPFERLGAEQTEIDGTGLGLALSRALAQAMGGTLGVESIVDRGSTFWVELPVAEGPSEQADTVPAPPIEARTTVPTRGTILYIEDNLSNVRLMERILRQRPGIELLHAPQGSVGLCMVGEREPNLIMLDLHLPDMSGEDVLRRLWEDSASRHIPVIILTADATPGLSRRLKAAGATALMTKPLDIKHALQLVDDVLHNVQEHDDHV